MLLSKQCNRNLYLVSFLVCFCLPNQLLSQVTIEPITGNYGVKAFNIYGSKNLENKERIPYSRIKGSPFWKSDWQLASIYSGTAKLATVPVRLNMATNEIHFLKDNKELVMDTGYVSTIVYHPENDSTKTGEIFIIDPSIQLNNQKVEGFVKVMNVGDYKLLKYVQRKVISEDSLFNTQKKYLFSDEIFYYLWFNENIERIKKLNSEYLLPFFPSTSAITSWIDKNKIDLKKEDDVIRFLNNYNKTPNTKTKVKIK